ncbi:unnamed protein product, partial [marine sediment metagenome]
MEGMSGTVVKTGNDAVKLINKKGTDWRYYNASQWVDSNQTYS